MPNILRSRDKRRAGAASDRNINIAFRTAISALANNDASESDRQLALSECERAMRGHNEAVARRAAMGKV